MRALGVSQNYKLKDARSVCEGALGSAKVLIVLDNNNGLADEIGSLWLRPARLCFQGRLFDFQQDYKNIAELIFRKLGKEESITFWRRHRQKKSGLFRRLVFLSVRSLVPTLNF